MRKGELGMKKGLCYLMAIMLVFGSVDMTVFARTLNDVVTSVSENEVEEEGTEETDVDNPSEEKTQEGISVSENESDNEEVSIEGESEQISSNAVSLSGDVEKLQAESDSVANGKCGDNAIWNLMSDGTLYISGTGVMYDYASSSETDYADYKTQVNKVIIEEGVQTIGKYAFADMTSLTTVSIPSTVTTINGYAFYNTGLKRIEGQDEGYFRVPDTVENIYEGAFANTKFVNAYLGGNLQIIHASLFNGLALDVLTLEKNLNWIETNLWLGNFTCETLRFGAGVTYAWWYGKYRSSSQWGTFYDPYGVFETCVQKEYEVVEENESLFSHSGMLFAGKGTDNIKLMGVPNNVEWTGFPDDITIHVIDSNAFYFNNAISGKVVIPESVKEIGYYAFMQCEEITEVVLPSNLTKLGFCAFSGCSKLETVNIPRSLEYNCESSSDNDYSCFSRVPLKNVTFEEGTERITAGLFNGCHIESITIPNTVKIIRDNAFAYSSLTNIVLQEGLEELDTYCFRETPLTNVVIPSTVNTIDYSFLGCDLESITIKSKNIKGLNVRGLGYPDLIIAYKDSNAYEFAMENGIEFKDITYYPSYEVDNSKAGVVIYDKISKEPLSSVVLSCDGVAYSGVDCVQIPVTDTMQMKEVTITAEGYHSVTKQISLKSGKITYISLVPKSSEETSDIAILSVSGAYNVHAYDLMSENLNLAYVPNVAQQSSVETGKVAIAVDAVGNISKYELLQNNNVIAKSNDGIFYVEIITKAGEITYTSPVTTQLVNGKPVYVRITDYDGNQVTEEIGIKVSKGYTSKETQKQSGEFSIGDSLKITVPDDVPLLGGGTLDVGFKDKKLPVEMTIDGDGTVKIAFNKKPDLSMNKYEEIYKGINKRAIRNSKKIINQVEGAKQGFGAGYFKIDGNVCGYGEGNISELEMGNLTVNVGIVAVIEGKGGYKQYFFVGFMPVKIFVEGKVSVSPELKAELVVENYKIQDFNLTGGTLNVKAELTAGGGIGAGVEVNASVTGSANYLSKPARDYKKLWIDASGKISVVVGWFEKPLWKSKKYSKVLYESGIDKNPLTLTDNASNALGTSGIYGEENISSDFTQMNRGYLAYQAGYQGYGAMQSLTATSATNLEKIIVKNAVYPSADAKLVTVGNKQYLFWLEDIITRSSNNRAALVYSVSTNGTIWSEPCQLVSEGENATPDLGYDVYTDGTKIYIVWQDGTRILSDEEDVVAMAESMGIRTAILNPADNSVEVKNYLTTTPAYYMYPRIFVRGNDAYTCYVENHLESQDIIGNNTHSLWYSVNQQVPVEIELPDGYQIINMELGWFAGQCYAICETDLDGDIQTDTDRELIAISLTDSAITKLTENEVNDAGLQVSDAGNIYWSSENNLLMMDGLSKEIVQVTTDGNLSNIVFTTVTTPEGLDQILFEKADEQESVLAIYSIAQNTDGQYGSITRLTGVEGSIQSKLSAIYLRDKLLITGLEGDFLEDGSLLKDLCIYKPESCTDLLAGVVSYDETQVAAGEVLPLQFTICNQGNTVIQNVAIQINGETIKTLGNLALQPGEEREIEVEDFVVPESLSGLKEFTLNVNVEGEETTEDNQTTFKVGYSDIKLETSVRFVEGHNWIDVVVNNESEFVTGGTLKVYKDSLEGEVIAEIKMESVEKGTAQCFTISLEDYDTTCVNYYVEVIADGEENNLGNNEKYVYVGFGTGIESEVSEKVEVEIVALSLDKSEMVLERGQVEHLVVSTTPIAELSSTEFLWTSSNPKVVSVDENGNVTALRPGSAVVSVHYAELSAECEVTVSADNLDPITILFDTQTSIRLEALSGVQPGSVVELPELEPDGDNVFLGWYTEPEGGTLINDKYAFYQTMTVYAHWQKALDDLWVIDLPAETYTGKAIKPKPAVYDNTTKLIEGKDYTLSYKRNTKVNDAADSATAPTVSIKGKGNYTGSVTTTFAILPKSLADEDIFIDDMIVVANNKVQKPVPTVLRDDKKLKNKTDFVVEYPDTGVDAYKTPGTYNVLIKAKENGGYIGERCITLTIMPNTTVQMSKVSISKIETQDYVAGVPATPALTVKYKGELLYAGTDYSVEYVDNDKAGTAKAILTGLKGSNYTFVGTRTVTFKIKGTAISKATVAYEKTCVYDGTEHRPEVTLTTNKGTTTLRYKRDYDVEYLNNIKAGKATIVIKGMGGYTGTVKKTFTITAYDVNNELVRVENCDVIGASYEKTGAKPMVTVYYDNRELSEGIDYTITYKDNKKVSARDASKAPKILIKGKGNFKGTLPVTFEITKKDISDVENPITVTATDVVINTKGKYKAKVTVTDSAGKKLTDKKDYQIEAYEYNDGAGTALPESADLTVGTELKVRIKGINNYTGTAEVVYKVVQKDISKLSIKISSQVYTGKEITFTEDDFGTKIKVSGKKGESLPVYGTDYIITGYTKNINKGKATVTFKGISETWGGSKTVTFQITSKKMKWFWDLLF